MPIERCRQIPARAVLTPVSRFWLLNEASLVREEKCLAPMMMSSVGIRIRIEIRIDLNQDPVQMGHRLGLEHWVA